MDVVDMYRYGWKWMDIYVCPGMYVDVFENVSDTSF